MSASEEQPKTKLGGLLSLNVQLDPPDDSTETTFQYVGQSDAATPPLLEVDYLQRDRAGSTTLVWTVGMLLVCWFLRSKLLTVRAAIGVIGLTGPLGLVSLAPTLLLPALDGIFLGTLGGMILWLAIPLCRTLFSGERSLGGAIKAAVHHRITAVLLAALLSSTMETALHAAEKKPAPPTPKTKPVAPIIKPSQPTIVIPYDAAGDPLQAERVFLPYPQFVELWNQAHPDKRIQALAPVESTIAEALYAAEIDGTVVKVTGRIVAYSFRDGQIRLPLPLGTVAIDSAQLNGKTAPLRSRQTKSGGVTEILLGQPGMHVIDLSLRLPLEQTGPAGRFTFPLKAIPAGTLRFKLPTADLNLRVGGSSGAYRRQQLGDEHFAVIPIDNGGDIAIGWQPRQTRAGVDGIIHTDVATVLSVDDAGVNLASSFAFHARQGAISDITFSLPSEVTVRQIRGPDVGGWEMNGAGENRTLRVFLRRKIADKTELQFDLFLAKQFTAESQKLRLPDFAPQNVTRETGRIAIYAGKQFAVTTGAITSLTQIETAGLTLPVQYRNIDPKKQSPLIAYRYTSRPFQLELLIRRQQPALTGTARHAVLIGTRKIRMHSAMQLKLAGAPKSTIALSLPPGYLLLDAAAPNLTDWSITTTDDGHVLHLELATPTTGTVPLELSGVIPRAPDDLKPAILVPTPVADELRSQVAIWLDDVYTATMSDVGAWRPVAPDRLDGAVRARIQRPVQFAFAATGTALTPINLSLQRREPQLAAAGLTTIIASETAIEYSLAFKWKITRAAAGTFVFTTPDWLAGKLDFQGNGFRQILESPAGEGRIRWTVQLDDPLREQFFLVANATLPPPTDGKVVAPPIHFEGTQADGDGNFSSLESQQHYVILINQSRNQLDQATAAAVEATTAEEVQIINLPKSLLQQAVEILRIKQFGAAVTWNIRKMEQVKDLPASVNLADNVLVIAPDGSWRAQASYRINNRNRQFLALRMPEKSRILSVYVDDKPSRPVRTTRDGKELLLIALPKTVAGDFSFTAKIVYAGNLPAALPSGLTAARLNFDLPHAHVVARKEDETFGIPVARTNSTVYLPENIDAAVLDDPGRTNLKVVPVSLHDYDRKVSVLNEAMEMLAAADNSGSMKEELYGRRLDYNLEKLQQQQEEFSQLEGKNDSTIENEKLAELQQFNAKVGRKIAEAQRRNSSRQRASDKDKGRAERFPELVLDPGNILQSNRAISRELNRGNPLDGKEANGEQEKPNLEVSKESLPIVGAVGDSKSPKAAKPRSRKSARKTQQRRGRLQEQAAQQKAELEETDGLSDTHYLGKKVHVEAEQTGRLMIGAGINSDTSVQGSVVLDEKNFDLEGRGDNEQDPFTAQQWTAAGGLSLLIDLPTTGRKLTLSKVGGAPKLAVSLRPVEFQKTLFGAVWLAVWGGLGLGIVAALRRPRAAATLLRLAPSALVLIGGLWYFLLPLAPLGFALLMLGAVWYAIRHRHVTA